MCAGVEQANVNAAAVGMKTPQKIVGSVGPALSGTPQREAVADGHGRKLIGVEYMDVGAPMDLPVQTFWAVEVLIAGRNIDRIGRDLRKCIAKKRRRFRREPVLIVQIPSTEESVSVGAFHKL